MSTPELRARIRQLFYAEHWKIGTIAVELGVHRDTVELALESERFVNLAFRASASILDPYKDFVRVTLEHHPRLRSTRLLQMIEPRGYKGSIFPLRRFVQRIRKNSSPRSVFSSLDHRR